MKTENNQAKKPSALSTSLSLTLQRLAVPSINIINRIYCLIFHMYEYLKHFNMSCVTLLLPGNNKIILLLKGGMSNK